MTTLFYILLLSQDQCYRFVPLYLVVAIFIDLVVGTPKIKSLINALMRPNYDRNA